MSYLFSLVCPPAQAHPEVLADLADSNRTNISN